MEKEEFQNRLNRLRKEKGLTLEALAEAVETTKSNIWTLENKPHIRPSAGLVYRLSEALDVSMEYLICKHDSNGADQVFMRNYARLTKKNKSLLFRIMIALEVDQAESEPSPSVLGGE